MLLIMSEPKHTTYYKLTHTHLSEHKHLHFLPIGEYIG